MTNKSSEPQKQVDQKAAVVRNSVSVPINPTIAAGARVFGVGAYQIDPPGRMELLDLAMRIRVDTDDSNHDWPAGASLTLGQTMLRPSIFWADYNDEGPPDGNDNPAGFRTFGIHIENTDSNSHNYFIRFKVYSLNIAGEQL